MLLKVGDLAKRCGLTVRMLHHYDSIGLLMPSARSDSGYRLYDKADIARLHQIQALRRFGMSLADVGAFLANPDASLTTIMERQIVVRGFSGKPGRFPHHDHGTADRDARSADHAGQRAARPAVAAARPACAQGGARACRMAHNLGMDDHGERC